MSPSRGERSKAPGPRTPTKRKRSRSQTSPRGHWARSPNDLGLRKDLHYSPSPTWSLQPSRQEGHRLPDRRRSESGAYHYPLHRSSRRYSPKPWDSKALSQPDRAPEKTSKQTRPDNHASKQAKRRAVGRVDQIMEPTEGRNEWNTQLVKDFLNEHVRSRTILDYVIFQKETKPRRFQVAIKHRYIIDHLTWPEWHAYKQANIRVVTL